jgi:hypothetical protein
MQKTPFEYKRGFFYIPKKSILHLNILVKKRVCTEEGIICLEYFACFKSARIKDL